MFENFSYKLSPPFPFSACASFLCLLFSKECFCFMLQKDKRSGRPKIWLYRDKVTNEPKGDATVTYEDPHAALAAVEWFNNKDFHGSIIGVFIAESKNKDEASYVTGNQISDPNLSSGLDVLEEGSKDIDGGGGRGRGRGDASAKAWQQDGDWMCPNTRSVMRLLVSNSFLLYSIFF